jgi:hypothetical protein
MEFVIVDNNQLVDELLIVYNDKLSDDGWINQKKHVEGCVNQVQ